MQPWVHSSEPPLMLCYDQTGKLKKTVIQSWHIRSDSGDPHFFEFSIWFSLENSDQGLHCHPFCIFWMYYCTEKPNCSTFRTVMMFLLTVLIFWIFTKLIFTMFLELSCLFKKNVSTAKQIKITNLSHYIIT